MGLNYKPVTLFNPAWVEALRGAPESAMAATVVIFDPHESSRVYDAETDEWIEFQTVVYTGKARLQPIRNAGKWDSSGNDTSVQGVLVSIPIAESATNFRPGQQLNVLTAPLAPALLTYQFVLSDIVDSSNEIERTLAFTINQESVVTP